MADVKPVFEKGGTHYFTQEWSEWFRKGMNWRNFHLLEASYEDECFMGQREIRVFLLGFGISVQWCYAPKAAGLALVQDRMVEVMLHPEAAIPLEEFLAEREKNRREKQE